MAKKGVLKQLFRLARRIGPAVVVVLAKYGPQVRKLVEQNPEFLTKVTQRFRAVTGAKEPGTKTGDSFEHRVQVLKEQVTYLYASANTPQVAQKASEWRAKLDAIERSIPVLNAMSRSKRGSEKREISRRLDQLAEQIMAASLIDEIEDAEFEEETPQTPRSGQTGTTRTTRTQKSNETGTTCTQKSNETGKTEETNAADA
ncbi:hypothetical protein SAMN05421878_11637 [Actinobaculum suis]|uniref:Uncharacterized protein n=1 Tax=Actinobaculum suis TaxID=1657 RepID=A0A1G7EBY5_9ACTO|nr:hypothetical protein [Actinobaculum suis]MDY5153050.1 hypothetical protein [Actinobaculum suis]SDE61140.1 hypothetical protein SAMN05421878_11637 [Actinobaculum suis]